MKDFKNSKQQLDVTQNAYTDGTLTGYETTEDFVNALKKNIKINQVCTDDVTKCFAKNITFGKYNPQVVTIANDNITFRTSQGQDWAETVGVRFANGVNALIAYNKNCSDDPYNNQYSPSASCIGIVYDVQANKQPNTYGKDIDINKNVFKIAGKGLCEYELADGTCFSKILSTQNGGYSALSNADCKTAKNKGEIDVSRCDDDINDFYAGAVLACGGKKANLPTEAQLTTLAQEVYNNTSITLREEKDNITLDTEKATPFLAQSPYQSYNAFYIWSSNEDNAGYAYFRNFSNTHTYSGYGGTRNTSSNLAVCVSTEE